MADPSILVIFDLDDTLFLERDFVRSGFAAVGRWMARTIGISNFDRTCLELFEGGHRKLIFDLAAEHHALSPDPALIDRLVTIYRTHDPRITLSDDARRYFDTRRQDLPIGLITDGLAVTQRAKVRALGIGRAFGRAVFTGALGPGCGKPHPLAFEQIESWAKPFGLRLAYVGDNPSKDFVTPKGRGWLTVRIDRPERIHDVGAPSEAHEAHARITSLDELDACLFGLKD